MERVIGIEPTTFSLGTREGPDATEPGIPGQERSSAVPADDSGDGGPTTCGESADSEGQERGE